MAEKNVLLLSFRSAGNAENILKLFFVVVVVKSGSNLFATLN